MRSWVAGLGVLLVLSAAGCGAGVAPASEGASSPAREASGVRVSTPARASTPRTVAATSFRCRLPVVVQAQTAGGPPGYAGAFLDTQSGALVPDPAGTVRTIGAYADVATTVATPALLGSPGRLAWSGTRWVPVPPALIAPDRRSYTWAEPASEPVGVATLRRIHAVDIATGTDRVLLDGTAWSPVAWTPRGIVVNRPRWETSPLGAGILDPATGALRTLAETGSWYVVSGDSAFGDTADYSIGQPGPGTLSRLDLVTGQVEPWLSAPAGMVVAPIGPSARGVLASVYRQFVQAGESQNAVAVEVRARGDSVTLPASVSPGASVVDGDRTWITTAPMGPSGPDLYVWTGSAELVYSPAGGGGTVSLAGGCA